MTGLEAFKQIKIGDYSLLDEKYIHEEELNIIEKGLEAIKIIISKNVLIATLKECKTVDEYNSHVMSWNELAQEEFNTIKEVMKNETIVVLH